MEETVEEQDVWLCQDDNSVSVPGPLLPPVERDVTCTFQTPMDMEIDQLESIQFSDDDDNNTVNLLPSTITTNAANQLTSSHIPVEHTRQIDINEGHTCTKFFRDGCGCSNSCHLKFSHEHFTTTRNNMATLLPSELDLVVMAQIMAHTHCEETTTVDQWRRRPTPRLHSVGSFYHQGHKICKSAFLFLHYMGNSRFKAIKTSYLQDGIQPRYLIVWKYYYMYMHNTIIKATIHFTFILLELMATKANNLNIPCPQMM